MSQLVFKHALELVLRSLNRLSRGAMGSASQAALKHVATLLEAARRGADLAVVALKAATAQLTGADAALRDADIAL